MAAMMGSEESIYVGLDVGTSKVCVLVGHRDSDQRMRVIGVGVVPSAGVRKGGVVNLEEVSRAIAKAKDKAERTSGFEITSALVSLSGAQISSMNSTGMAGVSGRTIGADDIKRAIDAARSVALPYNRQLIHVVPRGYIVDGQDGIESPIGMHGYRLEVETHIVTASTTALQNLEKCVGDSGIAVDGWVLSSLASAQVVLTETEREMGVVLCDIGGGTCSLSVFIEGSVWHTGVIPVGGNHLTNDIAQGLHLPLETAESIKRRHGHAKLSTLDSHGAFTVRPFGEGGTLQISRSKLAEILEPRVEELFSLVRKEIKCSGYDALLPAGLVLTGGTSQLPGIHEVAADVLQLPVRLGRMENLRGLVDNLRSPAFSASIGLLHWASMLEDRESIDGRAYKGLPGSRFRITRVAEFLGRLLPG